MNHYPSKYTPRLSDSRRKIFQFKNHFGHLCHVRNQIEFFISPYQVPLMKGAFQESLRRLRVWALTYGPNLAISSFVVCLIYKALWWEIGYHYDKKFSKFEKEHQMLMKERGL
ncbi:hypothetical protein RF11_13832 [Thelohanellus kitauei]|uniref:Uncharacterized protein n=1 Tax=Thelohanellus kitauei TaxID=669202 RepID=A0A0C2MLF7_THEKT|nr:hypothetical protein RF11_13832 [Thelohanellus kitauei]